MTFDQLFHLLDERITHMPYTKRAIINTTKGQMSRDDYQKRIETLCDNGDEKTCLSAYMSFAVRYYGFLANEISKLPTNGALLYRGHKHINPFAESEYTKAGNGKVYFSNNPAYVMSVYGWGVNL